MPLSMGCVPVSGVLFGSSDTEVGIVAQLVEQRPFKALVQGSSPCGPTTLFMEGLP